MKISVLTAFIIFLLTSLPVSAEDQTDSNVGTAMATGASANVLSEAAIDYTTGSNISQDPWWKRALKRAMSGAASGAAAVKTSSEIADEDASEAADVSQKNKKESAKMHAEEHISHEHEHAKKEKDEFRPPGWDKGKKKGWGDGNVPPGLQKKNKSE